MNLASIFILVSADLMLMLKVKYFHVLVLISPQTHSILEDYEVKWRQKLGCGVSGPVRPCK